MVGIYKKGQGYWTRMMSAIAAGLLIFMGASWLWNTMNGVRIGTIETVWVQAGTAITFNTVQNAQGKGVWKDGTWKVVISRAFTTDGDHDTRFSTGLETAAAVAVWNGARSERSGVKSVSNWFSLTVGQ